MTPAASATDFFGYLTTGFAALMAGGVASSLVGIGPFAAVALAAVPVLAVTSAVAQEALDLAPEGTCPLAIYTPTEFATIDSDGPRRFLAGTIGNVWREDKCFQGDVYEMCSNSQISLVI